MVSDIVSMVKSGVWLDHRGELRWAMQQLMDSTGGENQSRSKNFLPPVLISFGVGRREELDDDGCGPGSKFVKYPRPPGPMPTPHRPHTVPSVPTTSGSVTSESGRSIQGR